MAKKAAGLPVPDQNQIEELKQQVTVLTEALQRERADATNQRRQFDVQLAGAQLAAKTRVITELLPVIDSFERALRHTPKDLADNDYIKGVQAITKQFEKTLSTMGVERIATVGTEFDPQLHEAISMEPGDGAKEIVSEELQAGYRIGDTVLRHAMVRVKAV